jgi:hypothetical protein
MTILSSSNRITIPGRPIWATRPLPGRNVDLRSGVPVLADRIFWDVAAIAFIGLWFLQIVWAGREAGIKRRIAWASGRRIVLAGAAFGPISQIDTCLS